MYKMLLVVVHVGAVVWIFKYFKCCLFIIFEASGYVSKWYNFRNLKKIKCPVVEE